jgi:hypothetical protein
VKFTLRPLAEPIGRYDAGCASRRLTGREFGHPTARLFDHDVIAAPLNCEKFRPAARSASAEPPIVELKFSPPEEPATGRYGCQCSRLRPRACGPCVLRCVESLAVYLIHAHKPAQLIATAR